MDEVTSETPTPEQPQPHADGPLLPTEPVPPIQSRFLFVDVAALRAKQLLAGCIPRLDGDHSAAIMAQLEVAAGCVVRAETAAPEPKPET